MSLTRVERESLPQATKPSSLLDRLEWLFFVFVLAYGAGAILPLLVIGPAPLRRVAPVDNSALLAAWAGSYVIFGLFALRRVNLLYASMRQNVLLLSLLVLMILSALWAENSALSVQRSATVAIGTLIGAYLGARYGAEGTMRLLASALAVALVASLAVIFLLPSWGTMSGAHRGAWAGAFLHKNQLGSMALLGLLAIVYVVAESQGTVRRWWLALAGGAVILLLGARSVTALLGMLMLPLAALGLRVLRGRRGDLALILTWLAVIAVALIPLVSAIMPSVLAVFGRDMTFTGRTELWQLGLQSFSQRPFLGYGFDAFWENTTPYGGAHIRRAVGWLTPHIHNSWLELALELGLVGVALYAIVLFRALGQAARLLRATENRVYLFMALFLLYLCFYSAVEDVFLPRNDVLHIVFVALAVAAQKDMRALGRQYVPRIKAPLASPSRQRRA